MTNSFAAAASFRRLVAGERERLLPGHFLRLDGEDRRLRFGGHTGEERVRAYCTHLDRQPGALVLGCFLAGELRAVGELVFHPGEAEAELRPLWPDPVSALEEWLDEAGAALGGGLLPPRRLPTVAGCARSGPRSWRLTAVARRKPGGAAVVGILLSARRPISRAHSPISPRLHATRRRLRLLDASGG